MIPALYWFVIGALKLLLLSYQDIKKKKWVDDRHNYFMMGVTISLLTHYPHKLLFATATTVVTLALVHYIKKFNLMGAADRSTILWCYIGLAFIDMWALVWFNIIFAVLYVIQIGLKNLLFKTKETIPAYPLFFLSFSLVGLMQFLAV